MNNSNLIVVLGPTATGKTKFAANLALKMNGEIISADSRQLYKRMNLGTGKDYEDYFVEGKHIPCHLIDIYDPGYKSNVFEYKKAFIKAYQDLKLRNRKAILCGGTGLYIEAVTQDYKLVAVPVNSNLREELKDKTLSELEQILALYKKLHNKTDTDTKKRAIRAIEIEEFYKTNMQEAGSSIEINPVFFGIRVDREIRRERITNRLKARLKEGMLEEAESLLNEGISPEDMIYYGLEYKYLTLHLTGEIDYKTMVEKLNIAIHQFAKRQMTWFRKMEREGVHIHWIDGMKPMNEMVDEALQIISAK
ncbi:MAG: tRNA (adenosine(37)-N6)-dimethylallyltransferase MiaA [Bacteroidales bacterium]|nr:tRNA (adenosine(37)-N6)-dimethylallyltransferase MiaA [Bacteroidales bacterium]MBN2818856.1 tRNA (adenosine(37)-N6)-dimethylallyltransferase MiaA [Bacteroidales bacterium]